MINFREQFDSNVAKEQEALRAKKQQEAAYKESVMLRYSEAMTDKRKLFSEFVDTMQMIYAFVLLFQNSLKAMQEWVKEVNKGMEYVLLFASENQAAAKRFAGVLVTEKKFHLLEKVESLVDGKKIIEWVVSVPLMKQLKADSLEDLSKQLESNLSFIFGNHATRQALKDAGRANCRSVADFVKFFERKEIAAKADYRERKFWGREGKVIPSVVRDSFKEEDFQ